MNPAKNGTYQTHGHRFNTEALWQTAKSKRSNIEPLDCTIPYSVPIHTTHLERIAPCRTGKLASELGKPSFLSCGNDWWSRQLQPTTLAGKDSDYPILTRSSACITSLPSLAHSQLESCCSSAHAWAVSTVLEMGIRVMPCTR